VIEVQVGQHEGRERHQPQPPVGEVHRAAERERHQRREIGEGGHLNGDKAPTGGQHQESEGEEA
jgi:hypothetical protein